MKYSETSKYMLKYQKAKAKLVEYNIDESNYPRFPLNSNELSYPTVYALSRYAESVIEDNYEDQQEFEPMLMVASQYYDAAVNSKDRTSYDADFLLSAAAAYFLSDDFGSAKVMCVEMNGPIRSKVNSPQNLLIDLLQFLLLNRKCAESEENNLYGKIRNAFCLYFNNGIGKESLLKYLTEYRIETYGEEDPMQIFFVDLLYAIVIRAIEKSSWNLLPIYSALSAEHWNDYLCNSNSIKMLWPSQQLIGREGILQGKNAIVQLPTGVGKTKGIELIIRSAFLAQRTDTAMIIAPLRALCNEITTDLQAAFNDVIINQFSDILEDDFTMGLASSNTPRILICTPEKLNYILHHQVNVISEIGLFIFDEGHMFDDGSRGATYELLMSDIRKKLDVNQQLVLLSAVLSNAGQIKNWLLGDDGVLASQPKIRATPKAIGFASATRDIHYYSDDPANEDFFVPRSIEVVKLNKLNRERTIRSFPNLSDSKDVSIYYASKLCINGGVAIFVSQSRSVRTTIERIIDLHVREYDLSQIMEICNKEELKKLSVHISDYYGLDHPYSLACSIGVVPHYSNLPNGLRIAIEHAFRTKAVGFVVCTSTLAQGVNIPIRYLFMTSFMVSNSSMQIRNFQNLMGRTARSGMYTEGSVIVTDTKIYDQKNDRKHGGNYKWRDHIRMFDANSAEPCSSSILMLVKDFVIDFDTYVEGERIGKYIIEHYLDTNCFEILAEKLNKAYLKKKPSRSQNNIYQSAMLLKTVTHSIENHLCYVYSMDQEGDKLNMAKDLCLNSLAYSLADEKERVLLEEIFATIAEKIANLNPIQIANFSKAMVGVDLSIEIEAWLEQQKLTDNNINEQQLLILIIEFFKSTHKIRKAETEFDAICELWLAGETYNKMHLATNVSFSDLEDICSKTISYELSYFIGNIIDVIEIKEEDIYDPCTSLSLLQRKIKYGVPNETSVSICEKIFNDRIIAYQLSGVIDNDCIGSESIIGVVKSYQDEISAVLNRYPSYFQKRLDWLCKDN